MLDKTILSKCLVSKGPVPFSSSCVQWHNTATKREHVLTSSTKLGIWLVDILFYSNLRLYSKVKRMRSAREAHHTQKACRALIYDHYKTHKMCLLNRTCFCRALFKLSKRWANLSLHHSMVRGSFGFVINFRNHISNFPAWRRLNSSD